MKNRMEKGNRISKHVTIFRKWEVVRGLVTDETKRTHEPQYTHKKIESNRKTTDPAEFQSPITQNCGITEDRSSTSKLMSHLFLQKFNKQDLKLTIQETVA